MKRIIITSCSRRKNTNKELLPAIQRYDGPIFQMLRKFLRQPEDDLNVYILSAKFGLLSSKTQIPFYDVKINKNQMKSLSELSLKQTQKIFEGNNDSHHIFVNLGRLYRRAFEPAIERISKNNLICYGQGSSGKRLSEMYDWLYGESSPLKKEISPIKVEKEVCVRGILIKANELKICKIVETEISKNGTTNLQKYQSWFVQVKDLKVSPKWLLSQLTGFPVSEFHTDQARKVLQKLGIRVERV